MNREDLWEKYAFSFDLNSPRRLLGLLLPEAFSTDLQALSSTDPDRAALLAVARFEYEVKKGGFAQLVFNLRNTGLDTLGHALVYAGASAAAQYYGHALWICRQMPADYARFVASDYTTPNALKDALHGISLEYLRLAPIETEVAPLLARFVLHDSTVTAIRALQPDVLGWALKEDLARGPVRPLMLDAVAAVLRATDPAVQKDLFRGLSMITRDQIARLIEQVMTSVPEHAILLAIPLFYAGSEEPEVAAWVGWALKLGPRPAIEVLELVRAAVTLPEGDYSMRKPVGLWPHMPLFEVVRAALASPDAEVRAAASKVPGPWSWSSAELADAIHHGPADDVPVLQSFVS